MRILKLTQAVVCGAAAVVVLVFGAATAGATSQTAAGSSGGARAGVAGSQDSFTVGLPDGTQVQLPGSPETVTFDQLKAAGITPGTHGVQRSTTEFRSAPPNASRNTQHALGNGATPDSAIGKCNYAVCEDVYGSGTVISAWDAYGTFRFTGCTYGGFWEPQSTLWAVGNEVCGSGYPYSWVESGLPARFSNFSLACATLLNIKGKPCALVYQF